MWNSSLVKTFRMDSPFSPDCLCVATQTMAHLHTMPSVHKFWADTSYDRHRLLGHNIDTVVAAIRSSNVQQWDIDIDTFILAQYNTI